MTPVAFHPAARRELAAAVRFYRDESHQIARAFAAEVRSTVARVSELPDSGSPSPDDEGTRRALVSTFPFVIVYRPRDTVIEILAVMHQRRRPGYWEDRRLRE